MKYLKSYKIFEYNNDIVMAGMVNAIDNDNIQLFKDLIEQHSQFIKYDIIHDIFFERNMLRPYIFTLLDGKYLKFFKYLPSSILKDKVVLKANNLGIKSLEGFEYLPNLEKLDIDDNEIRSLKDGKKLTKLVELKCKANELHNIKGISALTNLKYLMISDNKLITLKGIENLENLQELYCSGNRLKSLKSLKNLKNLTNIYCGNNKIETLKGIERLHNLNYINCFGNPLPKEVLRIAEAGIGTDNNIELLQNYYK